jgi:predicted choloylglycine hydrolase
LLKIGSLFGQGQVLKIKTKDNSHYQFGMQFNPEWTEQTFLPLALERGKVKTSRFSLIVRIIAIGYLIYWALERLN